MEAMHFVGPRQDKAPLQLMIAAEPRADWIEILRAQYGEQ